MVGKSFAECVAIRELGYRATTEQGQPEIGRKEAIAWSDKSHLGS